VTTKLSPPSVEEAVPRARLFELLDRARKRPVIWVGAAAGSGKSTLVASYARARGLRCMWYGVDARDADPGALFYYLGQSAALHAESSAPALPLLSSDHPAGTLGFARHFFEDLFQRCGAGLVVFDDCHALPATDRWYDLMREACAAVPEGISLVMISRAGPPPMLARMVASSRVTQIGWEDLRLSPEETAAFARARGLKLGVELDGDDVARLDRDFGGWAAGIVLALECARIERRPDGRSLASASEHLFDYFAAEVLAAAPPELEDLLLRSALLPTMTASLLDRMLGTNNAATVLARLQTDNFFVTAHGAAPPAYRYHPLFRDFLLARARKQWPPAQLAELQSKAAAALAEAGEPEAALELYLAASDREAAARLVVTQAPALVQSGRSHTLCGWIDRIGEARVASDPWLAYWAGAANLGARPTRAVAWCERAFGAFDEAEDPGAFWLAWRTLAQAYHVEGNDLRRLRPLVERALAADERSAFPSPELGGAILRSVVLAMTAYAPQSPELSSLAKRALSTPEGRDPEELALALLFHGFRGELAELSEIVTRWKRRASREQLGPAIQLWIGTLEVFRALLSGEFAHCQTLIRDALEVSERFGLFALDSALMGYLAFAHAALGETSALAIVADDLADTAAVGQLRDIVNWKFSVGLEALLTGDLARSRRYIAETLSLSERMGSPLAERIHRLGMVEVLALSGELTEAQRELDRVRGDIDAISHVLGQSARLCGAYIALGSHEPKKCDDLLADGLTSCHQRGFVPVPVPTRVTLAPLLRRARQRGIATSYVRELARKFELSLADAREDPPPATPRAPERAMAMPPEFSRWLRAGLRGLHETRRLSENRLLDGELVAERAGRNAPAEQRLSALRSLLRESVEELAQTPRTEPAYKALLHTYLDPQPTQLLAAEAARMSFGTYRRHLTAGLDELATALWLREEALGKRST